MINFFSKYKFISFLFSLLIISAVTSPIIQNYYHNNWAEKLNEITLNTETQILEEFKIKQNEFKLRVTEFKNKIESNSAIDLPQTYSYLLLDDQDSLISYNGFYADKIQIPQNKGFISFQKGLIFTFLIGEQKVVLNNKNYKLILSQLVEKNYNIDNNSFLPVSFTKYISEKYKIDISINYGSDSLINSDGRNHSFKILDSQDEILATVTFAKQGRDIFKSNLNDLISSVQSVLFLLLLLAFYLEFIKDIKNKFISTNVTITVYVISIAIFRFALYYLKIPSIFISGDFISPAVYSSSFGWGIASNPLELFISSLALLSILLIINTKFTALIDNKIRNKHLLLISIILFSVLFFFILRGYAAVLKSMIFDSSVNYLNNNSLILEFVPSVILFSALIISIAVFVVLYNLFGGSVRLLDKRFNVSQSLLHLLTLIVFQFVGFIFDLFQNEPLLSPAMRIVSVSAIFIIYFISNKEKYSIAIVLSYLAISASAVNSILLADFNNQKDERSIKVVAHELTRFDRDFIEANVNLFLIDEFYTLVNSEMNIESDPNEFLFYIWANSSIKENVLNSSFYLFDENKNEIGNFLFNQSDDFSFYFIRIIHQSEIAEPVIFDESIFTNSSSIIGITSFINKGKKYYLGLKINYDLKSLITANEPNVFIGRQKYLLSNQLLENLLILQIKGSEVNSLNQNIKIDDDEIKDINSTVFNNYNDAWNEIEIDGVSYNFYFLKNNPSAENSIAVGLQEKETPLTLFQFFKLFLVFALFIGIYGLVYLIFKLAKNRKITIDFRTKVAFSLIVISIAPLILLAVYFRNLTDEKNLSATFYKLNKRAVAVEEYINENTSFNKNEFLRIAKKANKDLGTDFNLYENNNIVYSSRSNLYKSGVFPVWLNSESFNRLYISKQNDILVKNSIENTFYNSVYYKTKFNNKDYVIEVNDLFNNILIPLSISDFDIILFGTYSLAAIFVIILSTFLANQISLPLRRLTNAAKSASYGDLNLNIQYKRKDEIGELTDAFNKMLNEIKKMQTDLSTVERESAWKEMAKQVAHEIKNPLTPMKLSMQQLVASYNDKSPKFDDIFFKVSNTILGQIENLKNIASEFSNFARMPIGEMSSVNIKEIITEVADLFTEENIKISYTFPLKNILVTADANHLKRIMINIIRNSIQADAEKLSILVEESNSQLNCRITDNGNGMPKEIVDKVFEKGFTTKNYGMGLGLNLAKRYLNNISGDIKIESTSNEGTTLLITIPYQN